MNLPEKAFAYRFIYHECPPYVFKALDILEYFRQSAVKMGFPLDRLSSVERHIKLCKEAYFRNLEKCK